MSALSINMEQTCWSNLRMYLISCSSCFWYPSFPDPFLKMLQIYNIWKLFISLRCPLINLVIQSVALLLLFCYGHFLISRFLMFLSWYVFLYSEDLCYQVSRVCTDVFIIFSSVNFFFNFYIKRKVKLILALILIIILRTWKKEGRNEIKIHSFGNLKMKCYYFENMSTYSATSIHKTKR